MSKREDTLGTESDELLPSRAQPAGSSSKPETSAPTSPRNKRHASGPGTSPLPMSGPIGGEPASLGVEAPTMTSSPIGPPPAKKSRTNTPWTPAEEQRLRTLRDAGNSWADIAKAFPSRTEGSVKKHWYKDMHYAEFAEDEALFNAIKEYDANKWKAIGTKLGKPAKACEQYAKEHFAGRI